MEKKRGRKPKSKPEGLGDTVEQVLEATGIAKVAKWLMGDDCGCNERKKRLNELFPYRKPNCLVEDEFNILNDFFKKQTASISPSYQNELLKIYNRVLNVKQEPTSCSSCWRDITNQLKKIHNEYKDEQDANS